MLTCSIPAAVVHMLSSAASIKTSGERLIGRFENANVAFHQSTIAHPRLKLMLAPATLAASLRFAGVTCMLPTWEVVVLS